MPPPLPKSASTELKNAAQLYWLYAFFLAVPLGIVLAVSESKPDSFAVTFVLCFAVYLTLLAIAGGLLYAKRKAGLYLGWGLMPLILLSFPIGTAVGVFIISKLRLPGVKSLLR